MIKMSVFNNTSDSLIVDAFKNVFQRRSSKVFQPDGPEFRTIQEHMLHWGKGPYQRHGEKGPERARLVVKGFICRCE